MILRWKISCKKNIFFMESLWIWYAFTLNLCCESFKSKYSCFASCIWHNASAFWIFSFSKKSALQLSSHAYSHWKIDWNSQTYPPYAYMECKYCDHRVHCIVLDGLFSNYSWLIMQVFSMRIWLHLMIMLTKAKISLKATDCLSCEWIYFCVCICNRNFPEVTWLLQVPGQRVAFVHHPASSLPFC